MWSGFPALGLHCMVLLLPRRLEKSFSTSLLLHNTMQLTQLKGSRDTPQQPSCGMACANCGIVGSVTCSGGFRSFLREACVGFTICESLIYPQQFFAYRGQVLVARSEPWVLMPPAPTPQPDRKGSPSSRCYIIKCRYRGPL